MIQIHCWNLLLNRPIILGVTLHVSNSCQLHCHGDAGTVPNYDFDGVVVAHRQSQLSDAYKKSKYSACRILFHHAVDSTTSDREPHPKRSSKIGWLAFVKLNINHISLYQS